MISKSHLFFIILSIITIGFWVWVTGNIEYYSNLDLPSYLLLGILSLFFGLLVIIIIYWSIEIPWIFSEKAAKILHFNWTLLKSDRSYMIGAISGLFVGLIILSISMFMDITEWTLNYIYTSLNIRGANYELALYLIKYFVGFIGILVVLNKFSKEAMKEYRRGG